MLSRCFRACYPFAAAYSPSTESLRTFASFRDSGVSFCKIYIGNHLDENNRGGFERCSCVLLQLHRGLWCGGSANSPRPALSNPSSFSQAHRPRSRPRVLLCICLTCHLCWLFQRQANHKSCQFLSCTSNHNYVCFLVVSRSSFSSSTLCTEESSDRIDMKGVFL